MADIRFKLGGKTYSSAALDAITLKDLLVWQAEAASLGIAASWAEIEHTADLLANSDENTDLSSVDQLLMLAVTIWASRRAAGEQVTFAEAIDFPMSDLEFLPEPQDHAAPKAKKSRPRKASGAGGSGRGAGGSSTTSRTSSSPSASDSSS